MMRAVFSQAGWFGPQRSTRPAWVLAAALSVSCATTPQSRRPISPTASEVVSSVDLARAAVSDESLMSALRRLRPGFLRTRGSTPLVVVGGAPPADLSVLEAIKASEVEEARLVRSAASASHAGVTLTGQVVVGDVIVVRLRSLRSSR